MKIKSIEELNQAYSKMVVNFANTMIFNKQEGEPVKLRPLLNRILVKPLEANDMSGSIYLPPVARDEEMLQGLVVEIGEGLPTADGEKVVPCKVKKDDKVLFQKYAGSEVTLENVNYLLIPEGNILAVLE